MLLRRRRAERRSRRRSGASLAPRVGVGVFVLVLVTLVMPPTQAEYAVLAPGYVQEDLVDTSGYGGAEHIVVRPDGSLLVTARRSETISVGGEGPPPLHFYALPPSGGRLDDANRLPNQVSLAGGGLVARRGLVYGISGGPRVENDPASDYPLRAYDPTTGAMVREVVDWWIPHFQMTLDPVTADLVLLDRCAGCDQNPGSIVRLDPDTGERTELIPVNEQDPPTAIRDVLAFTPDGSTLFVAGGTAGIDAFDRSGKLLYNIPTPHVLHGMVYGEANTCFEDTLFYLRDDQSLWAVVGPSATSVASPVAGAAPPNNHAGLTLDSQGRILTVTGLDAVTAIGPDLSSPLRADCPAPTPAAPGPPAPSGEPAPEQALPAPEPPAPPLASSGDGGGASAGLAAPLGPPAGLAPQTATATQPQASAASQASQQAAQQAGTEAAAQASAAPNAVALADAPEDQPVMGFSASARAPGPPAWASLALGAAAVAFMAATTAIVTDPRRVNPATAPNRRTTR